MLKHEWTDWQDVCMNLMILTEEFWKIITLTGWRAGNGRLKWSMPARRSASNTAKTPCRNWPTVTSDCGPCPSKHDLFLLSSDCGYIVDNFLLGKYFANEKGRKMRYNKNMKEGAKEHRLYKLYACIPVLYIYYKETLLRVYFWKWTCWRVSFLLVGYKKTSAIFQAKAFMQKQFPVASARHLHPE